MNDGSGGIRAVMISARHYDKLMMLKVRTRAPTGSFTLEKLIDAAIARLEKHQGGEP